MNKHENYEEKIMRNENERAGPISTNAFTCMDGTGKEVLNSVVFERTAEPFCLTTEELKAATRGDAFYQAVAAVAIKRGQWVVVDRKEGARA